MVDNHLTWEQYVLSQLIPRGNQGPRSETLIDPVFYSCERVDADVDFPDDEIIVLFEQQPQQQQRLSFSGNHSVPVAIRTFKCIPLRVLREHETVWFGNSPLRNAPLTNYHRQNNNITSRSPVCEIIPSTIVYCPLSSAVMIYEGYWSSTNFSYGGANCVFKNNENVRELLFPLLSSVLSMTHSRRAHFRSVKICTWGEFKESGDFSSSQIALGNPQKVYTPVSNSPFVGVLSPEPIWKIENARYMDGFSRMGFGVYLPNHALPVFVGSRSLLWSGERGDFDGCTLPNRLEYRNIGKVLCSKSSWMYCHPDSDVLE